MRLKWIVIKYNDYACLHLLHKQAYSLIWSNQKQQQQQKYIDKINNN